jgi:hypothetical protein
MESGYFFANSDRESAGLFDRPLSLLIFPSLHEKIRVVDKIKLVRIRFCNEIMGKTTNSPAFITFW